MSNEGSSTGLAGLVFVTGCFVIALHQIGGMPGMAVDLGDPVSWLSSSDVDSAIAAVLRLIGLVIGYWVLLSAGLYLAASLRGRRPSWVQKLTLPIVRRVVDRALATTLAASIAATPIGPALAAEPQPPVVAYEASEDGIPVPHVTIATYAEPGDDVSPPPPVATVTPPISRPAPPTPRPVTAIAAAHHTVEPGDSLWAIASDRLGSHATTAEIAGYWSRLIAANRTTLRSGDPNLIFPGEVLVLPDTSG